MAEITTTAAEVSTTTAKEWMLEEIEENDHLAPTSSAADTASSEEDDDDSSSASVEVKQEEPQSPEQQSKDNQEVEQEAIAPTEDNQFTHEEKADVAETTEVSKQVVVEDTKTETESLGVVQESIAVTESHDTSESSNQDEETEPKEAEGEEAEVTGDDDEAEEGAALDRRMTYIGEGLLDVGGMDAIDRLSDLSSYSDLESTATADDQRSAADVSSRHMSIDENYEFHTETQSPENAKISEAAAAAAASDENHTSQTTLVPPATPNKLLAFLAKGSEQKLTSGDHSSPPSVVAPKPTPTVLHPLPPPQQAPVAAPVKPQLPTVSIENRRSKLLDFLANDVGERYLDGVYQEETRDDQDDTTTDDEQDYNSGDGGVAKNEDEQEQSRQRRVKRANSKLLAFLAKERGERLHRVERGSEDASAQRNSISSETSSTSADGERHHQHAQPKSASKLLDFVAKVVPEKPKFVIFDPADAVSETEELEHLVAEEAQKKKIKRENREKARQKVLGLLAEETTHTVAVGGTSHSKHQAGSTVKSVDETKVQREKVTDRYGREGLLDFLDRTEAAQQRKIRWATSRNSSSSGSSSPSSSTTSSPKSSLLPPPGTPTASSPASSRSQPVRAAAPPAVTAPPSPPPPPPAPRSAPHTANRLASFLSKITSKASYSPQVPPRHESPSPAPAAPKQLAKSPIAVPAAVPAASVRDNAPLTSPASSPMTPPARSVDSVSTVATPAKADDTVATPSKSLTQKMQPLLTALSQISQTCVAHELNDVAIARIATLLNSISQIVKEDVQKSSRGEPIRRWSNASSPSPSWVKSGKEIEEFDKKHASVMKFSNATAMASTPETSSNPAVLERSSEPKVTVATSVLQSFNGFESAQNLLEIVATFHKLLTDCGLTDLKLAQPWAVYDHVKSAVASKLGFRQKQLFKLLDAKFNGDVYNKKPAARKRVCIIGAGPVGLRAAVEMALLGAQVVVLEKRKHFSRENILHLWPWVVQDLTSLGAKVLFPQFCHSTAYFHVGTRQLQCILLKVALLLGVTFFPATAFEGIAHPDSIDSGRRPFYTVVTKPQIPWMEFTAVLGACGTQDRLSEQARIKRFVFSRKEAIGLVCYFPNHGTTEEKNVAEFSWTIQFKQQMFAKMRDIGVDLENIVYYRGEMHYLVMTPKRQNLLDQGVLKLDYPNVSDLVLDDNIDKPVLHDYLKRVVDFVKIPQKAEFSRVRIFDFSSRTRADKAASILTSKGKKFYVGLIGDSLMEPFWPEGLGTCRGFLSALDGCWMVAQVGFSSDEQLLADRELAYRVIQHVSGFRRDDLQKNVRKYSVDPKTRYVVKFPQLCYTRYSIKYVSRFSAVGFWRERAELAQQQAAGSFDQQQRLGLPHPSLRVSFIAGFVTLLIAPISSTTTSAMVQARALLYAGIDAHWEEQQFTAFQQFQRAQQGTTAASFADFVFGRLLEEDLHVSCQPMLPAHVDQLHGVTVQGMCILQIVDVVNIGANFEHRKEDSKGPTRTLKICFTDGHQLVYGFEYRWLPSFSMSLLHGTKVVVLNVDIRHGLLMLTPQNCRLLGLSGNELLEQASKNASAMTETPSAVSSGAYSAALMTAQFTSAPTTPREQQQQRAANVTTQQQPQQSAYPPVPLAGSTCPSSANARIRPPSAPPLIQHQSNPPIATVTAMHVPPPLSSIPAHPGPPIHTINGSAPASTYQPSVAPGATVQQQPHPPANSVTPPVFVDVISSDEDCDSDKTDPMVQHLFYSPNTPRLPEGASLSDRTDKRSRKRPREAIAAASITTAITTSSVIEVSSSTELKADDAFADISELPEEAFSFSLLGTASASAVTTSVNDDPPPVDPSTPFQYFSARSTALSAAENPILDDVLHIRACIKSVAGFQFNTGLYLLKVIIEDCTETKEVSVDAKFVEKLMGVSCLEFMRAMQKTPAVAHQWAARMQFALMTLEGVMDFRMNPNGTFTLLDCRDVSAQGAKALLQRVRASVSR